MGTTLTGTTPQDTYDSLIKVADNGPLSGTAKYLSDGLGNDSVLSLSTAAVGVGTASNSYTAAGRGNLNIAGSGGAILGFQIGGSPKGYVFHDNTNLQLWNEVAGALLFGANATERMRITSAGLVGIGTSSPQGNLHIASASDTGIRIQAGTSSLSYIDLADSASGAPAGSIAYNHISDAIVFGVGGSNTERFRMTANGLCFNGDTAAANALDDYEEGTFTPTFGGTTRTGGSLSARYTKIGRLVSFEIFLYEATFSGSSGPASISGLPFAANTVTYGQGLITYNSCVDGNTNGGYVDAGGTTFFPVDENNITVASFIDGTSNRNLMVSGTYTV